MGKGPVLSWSHCVHADPWAAVAFHVPALLQLSEEEPGHLSGVSGTNSLPGHLWKMKSLYCLCVYLLRELCSGHSEETCKSPPEFMGGAFGLGERRNW